MGQKGVPGKENPYIGVSAVFAHFPAWGTTFWAPNVKICVRPTKNGLWGIPGASVQWAKDVGSLSTGAGRGSERALRVIFGRFCPFLGACSFPDNQIRMVYRPNLGLFGAQTVWPNSLGQKSYGLPK